MPILNFSPEFDDLVASHKKCRTIRRLGTANPIKVGDLLYLYTGLRTARRRRLSTETPMVTRTSFVTLRKSSVLVDNEHVDPNEFAHQDGFSDYSAMRAWFEKKHQMPEHGVFEGILIEWAWNKEVSDAA